MADSITKLKIPYKKFSGNKRYLAYYLAKYCEWENRDVQQLADELACSIDSYFKVAFCLLPDMETDTAKTEISKIASYGNCNSFALARVINRVITLESFQNTSNNQSGLMAARDIDPE